MSNKQKLKFYMLFVISPIRVLMHLTLWMWLDQGEVLTRLRDHSRSTLTCNWTPIEKWVTNTYVASSGWLPNSGPFQRSPLGLFPSGRANELFGMVRLTMGSSSAKKLMLIMVKPWMSITMMSWCVENSIKLGEFVIACRSNMSIEWMDNNPVTLAGSLGLNDYFIELQSFPHMSSTSMKTLSLGPCR